MILPKIMIKHLRLLSVKSAELMLLCALSALVVKNLMRNHSHISIGFYFTGNKSTTN